VAVVEILIAAEVEAMKRPSLDATAMDPDGD
jgi:hypothetical protein